MITSKYFSEGEFSCCSPSCSLQDMEQTTMNRLDTASRNSVRFNLGLSFPET